MTLGSKKIAPLFGTVATLSLLLLPFQNCGRLESTRYAELMNNSSEASAGAPTTETPTPVTEIPPTPNPQPTPEPTPTPTPTPDPTPSVPTPTTPTPAPTPSNPASGMGVFPEARVPLNFSVQMKVGDDSGPGLGLVASAGFGMMRKGIIWSTVEKTKGVYDFSSYDALFADAAARGQFISATLYGSNTLYGSTLAITTDSARRGFAAFAAAAAVHFRGKRVILEIWNEPNLGSFWRAPSNTAGIAREYVALVKSTVIAIKTAVPGTLVVAGSISCLWSQSFIWFDAAIAEGLLTSGIDALSVHPYGFAWPELEFDGYKTTREKMTAAGALLPIVNTEVGFDTGYIKQKMGYNASEAVVVQGWMLVRQQLVDLMSGIVYSNWYEFRESDAWGVVNKDFTKRPAFGFAQTFARELNGFKFVERLPLDNPLDFLVRFRDEAGRERLVAWTTSKLSDPAATRRPKPHAVTISINASSVRVVNADGTAQNVAAAQNALNLTIEGAPKYIYPANQAN